MSKESRVGRDTQTASASVLPDTDPTLKSSSETLLNDELQWKRKRNRGSCEAHLAMLHVRSKFLPPPKGWRAAASRGLASLHDLLSALNTTHVTQAQHDQSTRRTTRGARSSRALARRRSQSRRRSRRQRTRRRSFARPWTERHWAWPECGHGQQARGTSSSCS